VGCIFVDEAFSAMNYSFNPDDDTICLLDELIVPFLVEYFHCEPSMTKGMINDYFYSRRDFVDSASLTEKFDWLFHHDHPFLVASSIFFQSSIELRAEYGNVKAWLTHNGHTIPESAVEAVRKWTSQFPSAGAGG
jgi:hypothetical protein